MDIGAIKDRIEAYKQDGKRLFATSSLQTHSIVLLHIISRIDKSIPVFFINTGFMFPETIDYKKTAEDYFGLTIIDTKPQVPKNLQKDKDSNLLFTSDPDYCCYLNKIQPMEPILQQYDVWINGIRADQNENRSKMNVEQMAQFDTLRYHPLLNTSKQEIYRYIKEHDLPHHPLDSQGYISIGCEPCTKKYDFSTDERDARWFGLNKTECGLNTDLVMQEETEKATK